ncbi:hypothetical protein NPIL_399211 [Nephila pilipes]|nr:hypothetical protein NPIL_399211 [Nephila pilipes]
MTPQNGNEHRNSFKNENGGGPRQTFKRKDSSTVLSHPRQRRKRKFENGSLLLGGGLGSFEFTNKGAIHAFAETKNSLSSTKYYCFYLL